MTRTEPVSQFGSPPDIRIQDKYKPENIAPMVKPHEREQSQLDKLPKPTGYRILVLPYTPPNTSRGGIILANETVRQEELATFIGYVVETGPDAYNDASKFPGGAWCKKGDYIMFGKYAGAKLTMKGEDGNLPMRLLNDDEVLAVVTNPEDYVGVYV